MRIGGIASGMDTEQIIKELLKAERGRVDRYTRQEQQVKWRQEAYNTINKTMADFILNARKNFGIKQNFDGSVNQTSRNNLDWVKKAIGSDDSVAKATASANAVTGRHNFYIEQLAAPATVMSQKLTSDDPNEGILDENFKFKDELFPPGQETIELEINNKSITINKGDNIHTLVKNINSDEDLGIKASFDSNMGRLMLTTKSMGSDQSIEIKEPLGATLFKDGEAATGKDAIIYLNPSTIPPTSGTDEAIIFKNNNVSVFGINLNLQSTGLVNVNVDTDVDGVYDKIKEFIDEYNALVDVLNGLTTEKVYRDYYPLTKEEKEAMKDKEIELWEGKAKSGILRGDEHLERIARSVRSSMYVSLEEVNSKFKLITDLGISTGEYREGGKLFIDEEKLKKAIAEDPDAVLDVFFNSVEPKKSGPDGESTKLDIQQSKGLFLRMYDEMVDGMKKIIDRSGHGGEDALYRKVQSNMLIGFVTNGSVSTLDKDLKKLTERIEWEERILITKEERYWQQFTAMEKALQQMNQQSAWLMGQLGMGQ